MKNKKCFALIACITLISMTTFCSQAQDLGYWQRFKNWISGTPSQAQETAQIPYEWAKNFLSGFSEKEKIALAFTLGVMTANDTLQKSITTAGKWVGATLIGKQAAISILAYIDKYTYAKDLNTTIINIKKDLSDAQKFPTLQSKIDTLKAMQATYIPNGEKPNKVALQAVNTILGELEKENR